MTPETAVRETVLSDQQMTKLAAEKVFFGHQSVGADIVRGIGELMAEEPRLRLNMVSSAEPELIAGPAFVEAPIGQNRDPLSKSKAFATVLDKGMGAQGGIALYKFCYIDIDATTDVDKLFSEYQSGIESIKERYPKIRIVHVTVPLTIVEVDVKTRIKYLLGRTTSREINAQRNKFNSLLRRQYEGKDPIFDLEKIESTRPNGSRSVVMRGGQPVFTLARELTVDGGHLNHAGRRMAAKELLVVLANL
jgi:hypothetical protein